MTPEEQLQETLTLNENVKRLLQMAGLNSLNRSMRDEEVRVWRQVDHDHQMITGHEPAAIELAEEMLIGGNVTIHNDTKQTPKEPSTGGVPDWLKTLLATIAVGGATLLGAKYFVGADTDTQYQVAPLPGE